MCSEKQYASEEYDFGGYTGSIVCSQGLRSLVMISGCAYIVTFLIYMLW